MSKRLPLIAAGALAAGIAATGRADVTVAPSFQLVLDGRHTPQLQHEGTFSTQSSWCPSGTVVELGIDATTDTATRQFACTGGADFTATVRPVPAEHGGSGTWQIVGGTGTLAKLRGKGTFTSTLVSGTRDDPATIVYRSTWTGVADFDTDPPAITVTSTTVRKLAPLGTYTVLIGLQLSDGGGGDVAYVLQLVDPKKPMRAFVYKIGQAGGALTSTYRFRVPKTMRSLRLAVDATDAVGNSASLSRAIRLR